jgi:hypothetical protein
MAAMTDTKQTANDRNTADLIFFFLFPLFIFLSSVVWVCKLSFVIVATVLDDKSDDKYINFSAWQK